MSGADSVGWRSAFRTASAPPPTSGRRSNPAPCNRESRTAGPRSPGRSKGAAQQCTALYEIAPDRSRWRPRGPKQSHEQKGRRANGAQPGNRAAKLNAVIAVRLQRGCPLDPSASTPVLFVVRFEACDFAIGFVDPDRSPDMPSQDGYNPLWPGVKSTMSVPRPASETSFVEGRATFARQRAGAVTGSSLGGLTAPPIEAYAAGIDSAISLFSAAAEAMASSQAQSTCRSCAAVGKPSYPSIAF